MKRTVLLLLGMILMWSLQVNAQFSIDAVETDHTIDFETTNTGVNEETFDGSGFASTPATGQLNADGWAVYGMSDGDKDFGDENTSGDFARGASTGDVTTGGMYAFEVEIDNHALGVQPSTDDFNPGWIGLKIQNNTGGPVNHFEISYDIWVYNDEDRSQTFNGHFSPNGDFWQPVATLMFSTPEAADASPGWVKTTMTFETDMGTDLADGESFYIRWYSQDDGGSGGRDEIALDSITTNLSYQCNPIASFPYNESFEDASMPNCWTVLNEDGDTKEWDIYSDDAYDGNQCVSVGYNSSGNDDWLISPEISVTNDNLLVEFAAKSGSNYSFFEDYNVLISTTGNTPADFTTTLDNVTSAPQSWEVKNYTLADHGISAGDNIYVAIQCVSVDELRFQVDDFTVREISSETDFLTYSFPESTGPAVIDEVENTIDVEVGNGTGLTSLVADFTLSTGATAEVGGAVQESGVTENDFSSPVTYTVTAEDGTTTQDWVVTVTEADIYTETNILEYSFPEETGPAVIDEVEHTVDIEVNFMADLTSLVAEFELSYGATAKIGTVDQESGVTENDFTDTVTYTVTAEDGTTTQDWEVIVAQEEPPLGANCTNPYTFDLPGDFTYEHLSQTTCGLGNVFDDTDMGSYDNGEDAIYEITITEDVVVDVTFDAYSTEYTGIGLFESCPGNNEVVDYITNYGSDPTVIEGMVLPAGTYYLMIDSYEYYTECIPEYDLTIETSCLPPADIEATDLTPTTALVTWIPLSMGDSWNLKVDTTSIDPTVDPGYIFDGEVTPDPEQSFTGLDPDSTYYVYVQDNCGSGWSAEYTFTMPSVCPQPTDLFASALASDYAELDWNAYGETDWNIKVSTTSIAPETEDGDVLANEPISTKPYSVSGLDANTTYYFYVQSSCGSDWSPEGEFTTECAVYPVPFSEDFSAFLPECWSESEALLEDPIDLTTETTSGWLSDDFANNTSNPQSARLNIFSTTCKDWLISPEIDLGDGTVPYQLEFDLALTDYANAAAPDTDGDDDVFAVVISTDGGVTWEEANVLRQWDNAGSPYVYNDISYTGEPILINLSAYTGVVKIAFYGESTESNADNDLFVNNVEINEVPSCPWPTDITASSITTNTAILDWTENGSTMTWNIKVSDSSIDPTTDPGNIEDVSTTDKPYNLSGLDPNTTYFFYVQADCGTETSEWSVEGMFTTECDVFIAPFVESFENGGEIPACWKQGTDNPKDWEFTDTPGAEHIGDNGTIYGSTESGGYMAWVDDSDPQEVDGIELLSPMIDISSLTSPILSFYLISNNEGYDNVEFSVDVWDGDAWNNEMFFNNENTEDGGWEYIAIDLSPLSITGPIQIRFVVDDVNTDWYDDVAIDDVNVREINTETDFLTYSFPEQTEPAVIDNMNHTIDVEVGNGTDPTGLVADFTLSTGATAEVGGVEQVSGVTDNDFSSPVTYTVIAEDGTTQDWEVTVTEADIYTETNILEYSFPEETGPAVIDEVEHTVDIEVNFLANLTSLVAEFELSYGATATIGTVDQESGITENDFTDTVTYTVTAEDGTTTQDWDVIVTQAGPPLGANCDNPYTFELPADFTYEHLSQTTCGLFNVFEDTDMGSYDNGEDAIYEITITEDVVVDVTLDTHGTTYTGMGLFLSCPENNEVIDYITNYGSDPTVVEGMVLPPGTYYLMIDSYEYYTECIPEYDLIIEAGCPAPTNVTETDLTPTSALITWEAAGLETAWNLKVSETSIDPETQPGTIFDDPVSTNPEQALTSLTAETDYYVYVQADCGSDWTTEYMFTTPASCPQPTDLFVSSLGSDYADLDWNAYGATVWNIQVDTVPIVPETDTGDIVDETTTDKPYPLSGLDANTTYYFYVQSSCGTDTSVWSPEGIFTTECEDITEIPYSENFDTGVPPECWATEGGDNWQSSASTEAGGTAPEAEFNWSPSTTANQKLISPVINTSGYSSLKLSFKHYVDDYSGDPYTIGVATTSDGGATWNDVWTTDPTSDVGPETLEITIDNADMGSDNFQFAFYFDGYSFDINSWYIDDVLLEELVTDLAIIDPTSGYECDLTDTETIPVQFDNVGESTLAAGATVNFTLDSEGTTLIDEDFTLTDDLLPGESFTGFTTTTLDLSAIGTYEFEAALTYADDENAANDTIEGYIVHFEQEIEFVDAMNDTITINATDYPYTIESNVVYTPDSTLTPAYLWGDGSTAPSLSVDADGWYTLEVTTEGCTAEDSVYMASLNKIDSDNIADFAIYPNPTEGDIMLEMTLAEKQDVVITITNSSGQVVGNYKFDDVEKFREPIDLDGVAQGLYNLRVNAGDKYYTRQVMVK